MSPPATAHTPRQSTPASSTTTTTTTQNRDGLNDARDDTSEQSHVVAAATLSHGSRRGPSTRLAENPARTNIALQTLASSGVITHSDDIASGRTYTDHSSSTQVSIQRPTTSRSGLVNWLVDKGCTLWNWIMGVVMLAITAATYVVTKVQSAVSDGQRAQQDLVRLQEWQNKNEYFKYCRDEEAAGRPLLDSCQATLDKGLDAPPDLSAGKNHSKRSETLSSSNQAYDAHRKAQKALNDADSRISGAKTFLVGLPNPMMLARGVRRRLGLLFRSGRRLGTGQRTFGLPTFESSLSAMSLK